MYTKSGVLEYEHERNTLKYLKIDKTVEADVGIWKLSAPEIQKHEHKWNSKEGCPEKRYGW